MAKNWSDEELEASVRSYLEMKDKELKEIKYTKVDYYRDLSKKFGRSEKSFEYRMQNISFVLSNLCQMIFLILFALMRFNWRLTTKEGIFLLKDFYTLAEIKELFF